MVRKTHVTLCVVLFVLFFNLKLILIKIKHSLKVSLIA